MKTILTCALALCLGGCEMTQRTREPMPIRAPMPLVETPAMPKLVEMTSEDLDAFRKLPEPTQKMLLENDFRLKLALKQREAAISVYNEFAKQNNALNASVLGLPTEKKKP